MSFSYRRSSFVQDPCENKGGKDQHGKVDRRDEDISLGELVLSHTSDRMSAEAIQVLNVDPSLFHTSKCSLLAERLSVDYTQDNAIVLEVEVLRRPNAVEPWQSLDWSTISRCK